MDSESELKARWKPVADIMHGAAPVEFGAMHAFHARSTPRRLLYGYSYYKFACKLIGKERRVLDIGCGEGLGTWMLAAECGFARGVDFDSASIEVARSNWPDERIGFQCADVFELEPDTFDAITSFDVIEHILPENVDGFYQKVLDNLQPYGVAVIGTPNITSAQYASAQTNAGHVNLYSAERLEREMQQRFRQVLMFGANDEVVHTGFAPMCHYLLAVGIAKAD